MHVGYLPSAALVDGRRDLGAHIDGWIATQGDEPGGPVRPSGPGDRPLSGSAGSHADSHGGSAEAGQARAQDLSGARDIADGELS